MKDVIFLIQSGGTIGFTIQKELLEQLKVDLGDNIEIEIFKEFKGKPSFVITRPIRNLGGSKGVTIKANLVKELELNQGDSFQVDIRIPK